MLVTHGGRYKKFEWKLIGDKIYIKNEEGREHTFSMPEVYEILKWLRDKFGEEWFPLANNVELMNNGTEKDGLGTAILDVSPDDITYISITHAQGSSYLGVVLEEVGIFLWNNVKRGIQWRIVKMPETIDQLKQIIRGYTN